MLTPDNDSRNKHPVAMNWYGNENHRNGLVGLLLIEFICCGTWQDLLQSSRLFTRTN